METKRFRIGDFVFDSQTGELEHAELTTQRLPPQPSSLLRLLVNGRGSIVTREEIQQEIWPGVCVEFDSSLHFCIRQIRAAFQDSASDPKYIETIPRRGYRCIANIEAVIEKNTLSNRDQELDTVESTPSIRATEKSPNNTALLAFFGCVIAVVALVSIWPHMMSANAVGKPTKIAIMPFKSDLEGFKELGNGQIANLLLDKLHNRMEPSVEVIGPTTTEKLIQNDLTIQEFALRHNLDFVINGRYVVTEGNFRLLGEVIRVSDGVHVWVKYFEPGTSQAEIANEIALEFAQFVQTTGA